MRPTLALDPDHPQTCMPGQMRTPSPATVAKGASPASQYVDPSNTSSASSNIRRFVPLLATHHGCDRSPFDPPQLRTAQTGGASRAFTIHLSTSTFGSIFDFGLGLDFIGASVSTIIPAFASAFLLSTIYLERSAMHLGCSACGAVRTLLLETSRTVGCTIWEIGR